MAGKQRRRELGNGPGFRRFSISGFCLILILGGPLWGCTVRELPEEEKNGHARPDSPLLGLTPADSAEVARDVTAMLNASSASWNAGDLDGFLDDYWPSEGLTFSGASGVTRGWEGVRERYRRTYWAPGAERDSLRFENLEVMPLGPDHALALGQYVLFRPEEDGRITSTGYFSLVLWKGEEGWKIIHDHTSAAEGP